MKRITLEWHEVDKEGKPKHSCDCLVICETGHIYVVEYSAFHQLFNTFDADDAEHAANVGWDDVVYWAHIPAKLDQMQMQLRAAWLNRQEGLQ